MSVTRRFKQTIEKFHTVLANKKIIVFGTGEGSYLLIPNLAQYGLDIYYFLDNNEERWGDRHLNKLVYNPKQLEKENKQEIFILIASSYYQEIGTQLREDYRLEEGKHFCALLHPIPDESTRQTRIVQGVRVGKYSYGYERLCKAHSNLLQSIGAFCSINNTVEIAGPNHPTQYISTHPFFYNRLIHGEESVPPLLDHDEDVIEAVRDNEKIIIGNDVWIGKKVLLLPSIKIGNGAIIGAGAVVTKDVPDYAIVAGVPAKVIRYRFSPSEIAKLNKIAWWDWDDEKIKENMQYFTKNSEFLDNFGNI